MSSAARRLLIITEWVCSTL